MERSGLSASEIDTNLRTVTRLSKTLLDARDRIGSKNMAEENDKLHAYLKDLSMGLAGDITSK